MADQTWQAAMALAATANREMVKGNAGPLKQLYSHPEEILSGLSNILAVYPVSTSETERRG
jgi:hypothetical protein